LAELDATALAALCSARELSAVEIIDGTLTRISASDAEINAHVEVFADEARSRALDIDALIARGDGAGPLAGVPFSVKDVTWVKGARATNGSRALQDFRAPEDSDVVARMRAAGAILVGKTNNPELCFRGITDNAVYGLTRNPWDLERTPGGSSGGAGAAVAARMTPLALGSDGGGSIRIPSSFCGVSGLKPTTGRLRSKPGFRGWATLSTDGPIARTVRDLDACLHVLSVGRVPTGAHGMRLAYSADLGFAPVEPGVRRCFGQAVEQMREAGWDVHAAAPPAPDPNELWTRIALIEGYAAHRELLSERRASLEDDTAALIQAGTGYSASEYLDALDERATYTLGWESFFRSYDALLCPTMQLTAMLVGVLTPETIDGTPIDPSFDDWCTFCLPANLTGQPAASVPCGLDESGMPVGLQVIAPRWRDEVTLAIASAWQELQGAEYDPTRPELARVTP
jgi:Asp-tRNA(Asn)/Glu-tRNA(Gln) amidotransferase A subunit family amidase